MKRAACVAMVALALLPAPATASCMVTPLDQDIEAAQAVFIATITSARMDKPPSRMKDREHYVVTYGFEVARRIKGDPAIVSALSTVAVFDDPTDGRSLHYAEQSRYVPGDSILVVAAQPGVAFVSSIGCTASRPWNADTRRETAALPGFDG